MTDLRAEVVVVGGGLAGLCAAIEARRSGREVLLLCKRRAGRSGNTILAAGNLSGIYPGSEDAADDFVRDTLAGSRGLADPDLLAALAEGSASALAFLERCGVRLLHADGCLQRMQIPGHRRARTVCCERGGHPVATSGLSLTLPLLTVVRDLGIRVVEDAPALRLLTDGGRVTGVAAARRDGRLLRIAGGSVVLACGGGGRLYEQTNNTREITGDGFALAYEAGAELRDMEFVQFHPSMGIAPVRIILPTTLFGDGARLRNRDGEQFLLRSFAGGEAEAPRDVMSRAIFREVASGHGVQGGVLLDLSGVPSDIVEARYGDLWRLLRRRGCEPERDGVVVGLAVHFFMGGMVVDRDGASGVPGLYGAGEVTGGVHGANRLGGNALMEAVVFGRAAGRAAAAGALPVSGGDCEVPLPDSNAGGGLDLEALRGELRAVLREGAGVVRSGTSLAAAFERWRDLDERFSESGSGGNLPLWYETRHMLTVARLVLEAAVRRTESRGAHWRDDFPEPDDGRWLGSLRIRKEPGGDEPFLRFVPA